MSKTCLLLAVSSLSLSSPLPNPALPNPALRLFQTRPPLGWNPCNGFQCHMSAIGEATLISIADAIASNGMKAAGYTLFSLDDGYQGERDAHGALTANTSAFPSGTLAPLSSHLTSLGLLLGAYTDRGQLTCEKKSGSKGYESQDAATLASWGVVYLKEDSCNSSEVEATRRLEYGLMAREAAQHGMFLSVCGWAPTYAAFGGLDPPIGGSWRLGPDAGPFPRFMLGLEAAAGASNFTGFGRGWPDLDMLASDGPPDQELLRLNAVVIVGAPLLLSWDVRNASAPTLPLSVYLNEEVLAIHQDMMEDEASGGFYYQRVVGGAATGAAGAVPAAEGLTCNDPSALWRYSPPPSNSPTAASSGTLESMGAPGFCLAAWDLIPGGSCRNPINVYLLPCANASAGSGGCPPSAYQWSSSGASGNWTLSVGFEPSPTLPPPHTPGLVGTNPFPGNLLTSSGVPGALFLQPPTQDSDQGWEMEGGGAGGLVTLRSTATGLCLGASPPALFNVWARWLGGGDVALLLVNLRVDSSGGVGAESVTCDEACLRWLVEAKGGKPPVRGWAVRDVHKRMDLGVAVSNITSILGPNGGSILLRLSPLN